MMSNGVMSSNKDTGNTKTCTSSINGASLSSSTLNSPLMKFSSYFLAVRPWSLSASLMPTFLGSALAYRLTGWDSFSFILFVLTLGTIISVHGAGNVVNTYFDYIKGVDSSGKSDDRILVDHLLSKDELVSLGTFLYAVGCLGFVLLAMISPAKMEHLALVFFGGLSSSFLYTGGIGLKYIALGDVIILVIFGPISVLFAFMAQTGFIQWGTFYYAIPLALNTEAILHSNNTRDLESDRRAGIVTLAILIGHTASHILYQFLLFAPYITLAVWAFRYSLWFLLPIITLPKAFKIEKQFRSQHTIQSVPKQTARLNSNLGILYVVACLLVKPLPYL
ncbi:ubiA prenyltransferase domain-containing protein 1 homolog [Microplitis mediator]|uniref:ubiA prenyltransferase domain-containing protein 1 homolog n=1 Tax=Microplitis mediator TaxID=375433 RepID=UPI002557C4D1|nr:ubiA prenyltransferase domain-containing protein 1 homolog [Microplitis mediator]